MEYEAEYEVEYRDCCGIQGGINKATWNTPDCFSRMGLNRGNTHLSHNSVSEMVRGGEYIHQMDFREGILTWVWQCFGGSHTRHGRSSEHPYLNSAPSSKSEFAAKPTKWKYKGWDCSHSSFISHFYFFRKPIFSGRRFRWLSNQIGLGEIFHKSRKVCRSEVAVPVLKRENNYNARHKSGEASIVGKCAFATRDTHFEGEHAPPLHRKLSPAGTRWNTQSEVEYIHQMLGCPFP